MKVRTEKFEMTGPARIDISLQAGDVIVREAQEGGVTVTLSGDEETVQMAAIEATTDTVSIRVRHQRQRWFSRSTDVVIALPPGGSVRARLGACDIAFRVALESIDVSTGAGDVRIDEEVEVARVKIASGDLTMSGSVREAVLVSASGDIRVGAVSDINVNSASGSIMVGTATNAAKIKSASGDIELREFSGSHLDLKTVSGDVAVGLVAGMRIDATVKVVSGKFRNKLTPPDEAEQSSREEKRRMSLVAKSVSGNVTLRDPW